MYLKYWICRMCYCPVIQKQRLSSVLIPHVSCFIFLAIFFCYFANVWKFSYFFFQGCLCFSPLLCHCVSSVFVWLSPDKFWQKWLQWGKKSFELFSVFDTMLHCWRMVFVSLIVCVSRFHVLFFSPLILSKRLLLFEVPILHVHSWKWIWCLYFPIRLQ